MATPKPRLGRGLDGLIAHGSGAQQRPLSTVATTSRLQELRAQENTGDSQPVSRVLGGYSELPVALVVPNPYQPRKEMDPDALAGLAASIAEEGLLQPIVVRKAGDGYELIAGERRLRAFQKLKIDKIPARVVEATDASSATLALIENLQREGLNPIEEALGYASLIRDFELTQERAAERIGKNRASIANTLRLLRLSEEIQGYISKGMLSLGHAKVILGLDASHQQQAFARQIIEKGWSVRESEKQISRFRREETRSDANASGGIKPAGSSDEVSAIRDLEKRIATTLSVEATLKHRKGKGQLVIPYHNLDDLQRILDLIGVKSH